MVDERLAKRESEFRTVIAVEQAAELSSEPTGGFAALEGGLKGGLVLGEESSQTGGSGRA